ncbi:MAG: HAD family phosphatase [Flavobacteriaceae bacterium]|nr:HAD family phosphatase [Flavobacteriaceae bacterium]
MIKTIIFDFGDVFINLDKDAPYIGMKKLGITSFTEKMIETNKLYETGRILTSEFIEFYTNEFPTISEKELTEAWNSIILYFPEYRLEFLEELAASKKYELILLSNTNDLHIERVIENMTIEMYKRFQKCFDAFYLSQEIHLRKPNANIYEFVLDKHHTKAEETFFIDDTSENTETAKQLGIHTWNINPKLEDVINTFTIKKELF